MYIYKIYIVHVDTFLHTATAYINLNMCISTFPISLLPLSAKVFKSIANTRYLQFFSINPLLKIHKSGFCLQCSIPTIHIEVISDIPHTQYKSKSQLFSSHIFWSLLLKTLSSGTPHSLGSLPASFATFFFFYFKLFFLSVLFI